MAKKKKNKAKTTAKKTAANKKKAKKKAPPKKQTHKKRPVNKKKPYPRAKPKWLKQLKYEDLKGEGIIGGSAAGPFADCAKLAAEVYEMDVLGHLGLETDPLSDGERERAKRESQSGLVAFSYLYRRFGEPSGKGDDYKVICEYIFTTPMKGLALWVSPSGSRLPLCIGHYYSQEIWDRFNEPWYKLYTRAFEIAKEQGVKLESGHPEMELWMQHKDIMEQATAETGWEPEPLDWRDGSDFRKKVNESLMTTMKELLRPVTIRDVSINILGRQP